MACGFLAISGLLGLSGCRPEPIVSYTVPKNSVPKNEVTASQTRILAAIARLPEATWTIKASGDPTVISAIEPQWLDLLKSLQFAGSAEPKFELPERWRRTNRTGQFRDLILEVESVSPRLEIVFTRMPADFDLAANVNRWRAAQLGLPPIAADDLPNHLRELKVGEAVLLLFDATGRSGGGTAGMLPSNRPPAAGPSSAEAQAAPIQPAPPNTTPAQQIRFDAPNGWSPGATNPIVAGKFNKVDGARSAELSVVALKADSPWEQTVQIWSAGLGLPPLTPEQIATQTETSTLAGQAARLIRFAAADGSKATWIASLVRGDNNWIVKLTGDAGLVRGEQATWERFLQSLRFETADSSDPAPPQ